MVLKELLEKLSKYDPQTEVVIFDFEDGFSENITVCKHKVPGGKRGIRKDQIVLA